MLAVTDYTSGRKRVKTKFKRTQRRRKRPCRELEFKNAIQQYKAKYLAFRCDLLEELKCKFWK